MVQHVSDAEFENEVLKSEKPVVVDFWAEWCPPCRQIAPAFEKLAEENSNVKFVKVDVDKNNRYATEAGVRAIPSIIMYKGGKEINRVIGADLKGIMDMVQKA